MPRAAAAVAARGHKGSRAAARIPPALRSAVSRACPRPGGGLGPPPAGHGLPAPASAAVPSAVSLSLSAPAAIEPIPGVVELWQAEEGELLLPAQVRGRRGGAVVGAGGCEVGRGGAGGPEGPWGGLGPVGRCGAAVTPQPRPAAPPATSSGDFGFVLGFFLHFFPHFRFPFFFFK